MEDARSKRPTPKLFTDEDRSPRPKLFEDSDRPARPSIFGPEDKPKSPSLFEPSETSRLCRHCRHYVVNPFVQRCMRHRKEVEATDSCDQFEPGAPSREASPS